MLSFLGFLQNWADSVPLHLQTAVPPGLYLPNCLDSNSKSMDPGGCSGISSCKKHGSSISLTKDEISLLLHALFRFFLAARSSFGGQDEGEDASIREVQGGITATDLDGFDVILEASMSTRTSVTTDRTCRKLSVFRSLADVFFLLFDRREDDGQATFGKVPLEVYIRF